MVIKSRVKSPAFFFTKILDFLATVVYNVTRKRGEPKWLEQVDQNPQIQNST